MSHPASSVVHTPKALAMAETDHSKYFPGLHRNKDPTVSYICVGSNDTGACVNGLPLACAVKIDIEKRGNEVYGKSYQKQAKKMDLLGRTIIAR